MLSSHCLMLSLNGALLALSRENSFSLYRKNTFFSELPDRGLSRTRILTRENTVYLYRKNTFFSRINLQHWTTNSNKCQHMRSHAGGGGGGGSLLLLLQHWTTNSNKYQFVGSHELGTLAREHTFLSA